MYLKADLRLLEMLRNLFIFDMRIKFMAYKYSELKKEFAAHLKKSRDKTTRAAWEFCNEKNIDTFPHDNKPSQKTIYEWYHSLSERR